MLFVPQIENAHFTNFKNVQKLRILIIFLFQSVNRIRNDEFNNDFIV
jgi:hypothetical protein